MPQFSLEPAVTRQELARIWSLLRQEMDRRGYRFQEELAKSLGASATEISKLKKGELTRKWGFARMRRYADWLGMSVDAMLGRPEGTTQVHTPSGRTPDRLTVSHIRAERVLVSSQELLEQQMEVAREYGAIKDLWVSALLPVVKPPEQAQKLALKVLKDSEVHILRIIELGRNR